MNGYQIMCVSRGTLGGFGVGIVVSTIFLVATTPAVTTTTIFTDVLTLAMTAIGFGLGLGEGLQEPTEKKVT